MTELKLRLVTGDQRYQRGGRRMKVDTLKWREAEKRVVAGIRGMMLESYIVLLLWLFGIGPNFSLNTSSFCSPFNKHSCGKFRNH